MVDVVIVGAGLAGLSCARTLHAAGVSFVILEADDAPGGRVRTDESDGFRMDRGFQVLLTAYPEARRQLDFAKLDLKSFVPGAMVRVGGRFRTLADPFRQPRKALSAALDRSLTFKDKLLIAKLRTQLFGASAPEIFQGEQQDTRAWLKQYGFSDKAITHFFAPFFGGVFLDPSLRESSRFFRWLFQCFARGETVVPALGMEQIPRQLASVLPPQRLLTHSTVTAITRVSNAKYSVDTAMRQTVDARAVVIATDAEAARMLAGAVVGTKQIPSVGWNGTTTFYFGASRAEIEEPVLLLNGEGDTDGPVNHACFISRISPRLAPAGAALFCANVVGRAPAGESERLSLAEDVRGQMRRWFGRGVDTWEMLGGYFLPHALPLQRYADWEQGVTQARALTKGRGRREEAAELYLCGDYCEQASIQGALVSGRRTAEALLETLR